MTARTQTRESKIAQGPFFLTIKDGSLVLLTGTYEDRGPDFAVTSAEQLYEITGDCTVKASDRVPFGGEVPRAQLTTGELAAIDSIAHYNA